MSKGGGTNHKKRGKTVPGEKGRGGLLRVSKSVARERGERKVDRKIWGRWLVGGFRAKYGRTSGGKSPVL